jgi:hypothetical protein
MRRYAGLTMNSVNRSASLIGTLKEITRSRREKPTVGSLSVERRMPPKKYVTCMPKTGIIRYVLSF